MFRRGLLCSGIRGGLGLCSGLSCSLGGVLNGDTLSSPLSYPPIGAKESDGFLGSGTEGLPNALGLPALLTGGGIFGVREGLRESPWSGEGGFDGSPERLFAGVASSGGTCRESNAGVCALLGILNGLTGPLVGEPALDDAAFPNDSFDGLADT